jgi:hypothetical protein
MAKRKRAKSPKAKKIKFKCPRGKHKNWHYLPVWWVDERDPREAHYTVVECYGTGGKNGGYGYSKPFVQFDTEAELFYALNMMASDVMRYPAVKVDANPWIEDPLAIEVKTADLPKWEPHIPAQAAEPSSDPIPAAVPAELPRPEHNLPKHHDAPDGEHCEGCWWEAREAERKQVVKIFLPLYRSLLAKSDRPATTIPGFRELEEYIRMHRSE